VRHDPNGNAALRGGLVGGRFTKLVKSSVPPTAGEGFTIGRQLKFNVAGLTIFR